MSWRRLAKRRMVCRYTASVKALAQDVLIPACEDPL
nr:MAG TPA: hypothetical protein [Caudoviricetes sp.]